MIIDKFTIQTPDSIALAHDKLTWHIGDKPSPFTLNSKRVILYGEIYENGFRLCRLLGRGISTTIITGWFETVQSGTVIHLTVEVNLSLVIIYLLFCLSWLSNDWQKISRGIDGSRTIYIMVIIMISVNLICSVKDELKFYRKKLTQVFS
jgi:hypothetical protein